MTRRYFFFGALLAGALPPRLPAAPSANGKLNIAAIGAGGRGATDILGCSSENIVALADPDAERAAPMFRKFHKVPRYEDFRRMLDKHDKEIDAVLVSTPDFLHGAAALLAMSHGKHVFCQKPLTRTIAEARQLTEAAAKYNVITQMGNQGYSNEGTRHAAELIQSGAIGKVTEVHAWTNRPTWQQGMKSLPTPESIPATLNWQSWLGPAPDRPYSPAYAPFSWRAWYSFGCGALGDMGCHVLGPANMALRLTAPLAVECVEQQNGSAVAFPTRSIVRFDFPDVKIFWYDGVSGAPPLAALGGATIEHPGNGRSLFVGDRAFLTTGAYGEGTRVLTAAQLQSYPFKVAKREPNALHYRNWIDAVKNGTRASSDFRIAGPFTEWVLLGALAQRLQTRLEWDSSAMRVTNSELANTFLRPEVRDGWAITSPA